MKFVVKLRIFILFAVPLLLFGAVAFAPLPQGEIPEFGSLTELLLWVAGAGGLYVAGKATSYIAENWTGWHTLPYWVKVVFPIFLAGVLGIIAESLLSLNLVQLVPAPLVMAILGALNYYGTQRGYFEIKAQGAGGYGATARKLAIEEG